MNTADKPLRALSIAERTGLRTLQEAGGSVIEWRVPETTEKDVFGTPLPGMRIPAMVTGQSGTMNTHCRDPSVSGPKRPAEFLYSSGRISSRPMEKFTL